MRRAGVLMPIASLPSPYGIGDFGDEAFYFADLLKNAGVKIWQILPLNPLGYGNSPYQPYSSFAGDELYISLGRLAKKGLLKKEPEPFRSVSSRIDYEVVRAYKATHLMEAYEQFLTCDKSEDYIQFVSRDWVYLYAVFLTFKKANKMKCWNQWEEEHKYWIRDRGTLPSGYKEKVDYEMFLQYIFYTQWMELKEYCNVSGIEIMGDIPFYVGIDSLDVWANQNAFLLDEDGFPTYIAGVPPDYFSEHGQRWGNPIYDWKYLKENGYTFWNDRMLYNSKLFDIVRIDHFRAFDTYWKIPADCPTAVEGEWVEAPGYEVLQTIKDAVPSVELVAEDLGDLRAEVKILKDHFGLRGMKILQFAFDPNETNNDFPDVEHMIIYTGTHDNETIRGWYNRQSKNYKKEILHLLKKQGCVQKSISHKFIDAALKSIADIAVIPMQDVMNLSERARINTPGTVGSPNWEWKMAGFSLAEQNLKVIQKLIEKYGR